MKSVICLLCLSLLAIASAFYMREEVNNDGPNLSLADSELDKTVYLVKRNAEINLALSLPQISDMNIQYLRKKKNRNQSTEPPPLSDSTVPGFSDLTSMSGKVQDKITSSGSLLAGNLASVPVLGSVMSTASGLPGMDTVSNTAVQAHDTLSNVQGTLGSLG